MSTLHAEHDFMKKQEFIFFGETHKKGFLAFLHSSLKARTSHFCGHGSNSVSPRYATREMWLVQIEMCCSIKYTPDFKDFEKEVRYLNNFYIYYMLNDNIFDMLSKDIIKINFTCAI